MLRRISFAPVLALVAPIALVLLVVLLARRPAVTPPVVPAGAAPRPTGANAGAASAGAPIPASQPAPSAEPATRPDGPAAPAFDGGGAWINSEPIKLADLSGQGKVVLVDFWTYGCYNCRNTLPYLKQWWAAYKDQGLVIVGVHTPEFQAEHVLENVQDAVQREGIGWPVVQDNDYAIWRAYGNHYWPHVYLVDERGQIIYDHIGEGAYEETDRQIAAALAAAKAK